MTNIQLLRVRILNLNCYRQDEADGDEVFLSIDGKKVWPADSKFVKIKEGDQKVGLEIDAIQNGSTLALELWDYDFWTPNDKLGEFNMLINEKGGPFNTDMTIKDSKSAKYSIEWEVF